MKRLQDFFNIRTPMSGEQYALIGFTAFGLKFYIDHFFAAWVFHHPWSLWDYWRGANAFYLLSLRGENQMFFIAMLAMAIPFICFGVVMTLRRLNTMKLPLWMVAFFFLPYENLLFFALLILVDNIKRPAPKPVESSAVQRRASFLALLDTSNLLASSFLAVVFTSAVTFILVGFDTMVLRRYGWGLFLFLPFFIGLQSAWLLGFSRRKTFAECQMAAFVACGLVAVLLLCFAWEGVICILMAAPLWGTIAALGGWVGYLLQDARWAKNHSTAVLLCLICAMPLLMGAEYAINPAPPLLCVTSAMIVHASPETVWNHVVSFAELPPPKEWIFHTGLAYPIRAKVHGKGVGAVRHCEFSTGAFIEPIQVWQKPSLLRFSVTDNPPPMREMSLYSRIDPPHLHGFLVSRQGQFRLTRLSDGSTRLEGTTWYYHHLWPARYWQLWSDYIIHQIHLRVLRHIKLLSESDH